MLAWVALQASRYNGFVCNIRCEYPFGHLVSSTLFACTTAVAQAFQEDWVGESPSTGPSQPSTNTRPSRDNNFAHQTRPESLDIVRPGRFFTTLLAMRAELEQRLVSSDLGDVGSGEATLAVLQQMEAIRLEALVALDRIQHNRPTTTSSDVCYDYELDLNV